ncbi:MAG: TldD/PmbA family protein [Alphaproteobacteria bacterium]|nr:TldD/PmbA family protein [Alphaproteobacteria bacterium]
MTNDALNLLADLIGKACTAGADAADALLVDASDLSVSLRLGEIESLERSESGDLGLRVFIGQRQAVVSSTDRSAQALNELVERAVAMAKLAPEDPFCGIAAPEEVAASFPDVESADATEFSAEQLIAKARAAEDAARAVKGVTNSNGASAGWGSSRVTLAASNGFSGSRRRTGYSLSASVLAGEGTGMQSDYEYASRVFAGDLPDSEWVGRRAGERAVARLHSRKMQTARAPVFFDPRISGSLVGALLGAISGPSVARGTSFLKDRLGEKIFPEAITIVEDPFRARGLRSRAFDCEGLLPRKRKLIDAGVLTTWLLDLRSARQLKMRSTGHAARSPSGPPSPSASNVFMEAGKVSPTELMCDVAQGFYVVETMGMGINGVTGDYSQSAAGFWIENGQIAFPVNEMTIAGNLKNMFLNLSAANDLEFLRGVDAPTLRIDGMTIAGT